MFLRGGLGPQDLITFWGRRLVAYPRLADKYLGPLTSRLNGVNQPVIRTRNGFSVPCHPPLACL